MRGRQLNWLDKRLGSEDLIDHHRIQPMFQSPSWLDQVSRVVCETCYRGRKHRQTISTQSPRSWTARAACRCMLKESWLFSCRLTGTLFNLTLIEYWWIKISWLAWSDQCLCTILLRVITKCRISSNRTPSHYGSSPQIVGGRRTLRNNRIPPDFY